MIYIAVAKYLYPHFPLYVLILFGTLVNAAHLTEVYMKLCRPQAKIDRQLVIKLALSLVVSGYSAIIGYRTYTDNHIWDLRLSLSLSLSLSLLLWIFIGACLGWFLGVSLYNRTPQANHSSDSADKK